MGLQVLGQPRTPPTPTPRLWSRQGAHLSEDVYGNGFVLGREANMLGTITFPGEIAEKQEEEQEPLAGPDPLTVTCEANAE